MRFKRLCDHMQLEQGPAFEIGLFSWCLSVRFVEGWGFCWVFLGGGGLCGVLF